MPHIDEYLFQREFDAFKTFVEAKSGVALVSFASNPYLNAQEGYKYAVHRAGRDALGSADWAASDIGTGRIAEATIRAIEMPANNLLRWQGQYGPDARPHHRLSQAKGEPSELNRIELALFQLYREEQDQQIFSDLVEIFGRQYPLLAYLFFLRDRSRYLPIAPESFDKAFAYLGAESETMLCTPFREAVWARM